MAPEKAPAFQFYPKEFLTDGNVAGMSLQERGAYITLMCLCWQERSLPADTGRLANMVGIPERVFLRFWPAVEKCFETRADRLIHPRLEKERTKQDVYRRRQSDKGKSGAEKRWPDDGTGIATAMAQAIPTDSSPISYLRSPKENASHSLVQAPSNSLVDPEIAARAGMLVERYGELFALHRRGARHRARPSLDWSEACDLCRLWDDGRLEKLAVIVLTTDDPWISNTDRSFKIFALKATWADERLAAWAHEHGVAV